MKIKNIKINRKKLIKLAALSASLVLATTTLSSCGRESLLDYSELYQTIVVTTTDGSKDIVYLESPRYNIIHCRSIVSGIDFIENVDTHEFTSCNLVVYKGEKFENIANYLTEEELMKIYTNILTKEEMVSIISRIIGTSDKTKTLE